MWHLKSGLVILMMLLAAGCSKSGSADQEQSFERHIPLSDRWTVAKMVQDHGTVFCWCDSMYVEYNEEKVYLIDVNSSEKIQSFRINGSEVSGTEIGEDLYRFNLTNYLDQSRQYKVELDYSCRAEDEFQEQDQSGCPFKAELHRLNKFFMAECDLKAAHSGQTTMYTLEVLIKNLNSSERQGQFQYAIYDRNNHLLQDGHAPVFVDGNSEILFQKVVEIDRPELLKTELVVFCTLNLDGNVVDQVFTPPSI